MKSRLDILEKYRKYVALIMFIVMAMAIYDMGSKSVNLFVDGKDMKISTSAYDVESLLEQEGIEISKYDKVSPGLEATLADGTVIRIDRAFDVTISENGKERKVKTAEKTVEGLLKQEDMKLSKYDKVIPGRAKDIKPGDQISITRVDIQNMEVVEDVPYRVEIISDDSIEAGKSAIAQKGKMGSKKVVYEVVLENGTEVKRSKIEEEIISEPSEEIVKKGTKSFVITSRGDSRNFKKVISMSATAYTAGYESTGKNPGDAEYGITRSGTRVRPGVVAVDPNVIPLGSKLYIEPLGIVASAEDTGSAIKGNKIDIYMESLSDARRFGRKNVKVYILK